ncbi:serine-rich adhesin for platelets-like [Periplaneta americana]|uniref:serine-rich adhesin for platelets-like n=1 Tax=Periplaneta americana TaxID=6978 RepID=UPI0037E78306
MSLLAELEELQRCLEGTADSDSEEVAERHNMNSSKESDPLPLGIVSSSDSYHVETVSQNDSPLEETLSKNDSFPMESVSENDSSSVETVSKNDSFSVETVSKNDSFSVETVSKSDLSPVGSVAESETKSESSFVETVTKSDLTTVKSVSSDLKSAEKQESVELANSKPQDLGGTSEFGGSGDMSISSETPTNNAPKFDIDTEDSDTSVQKSFPSTNIDLKVKISPTKHTEIEIPVLHQDEQVVSEDHIEDDSLHIELQTMMNDVKDSSSEQEDVKASSTGKFSEIELPTKIQEEDEEQKTNIGKVKESTEKQRKGEHMAPQMSRPKSPQSEIVIKRSSPGADKTSQLSPENKDTKQTSATLQASVVSTRNTEGELKTLSIPVPNVGVRALKLLSTPVSNVGVGTLKLPVLCLQDHIKKNTNPILNIDRIEEMKILNGKPVIRVKKISAEYVPKNITNVQLQGSASLHNSVLNKTKCISIQDKSQTENKRKVSFHIGRKDTATHVHGETDSKTHNLKPLIRKRKLSSESVHEILSTATSHKDLEKKFTAIPSITTGTKKLIVSLQSNAANENVSFQEIKALESVSKLESKTDQSATLKELPGTALARKRRTSSDPTDTSSTNPILKKRRKLSASEMSSTSYEVSNLKVTDPSDTYKSISVTKNVKGAVSQESKHNAEVLHVTDIKKLNMSVDQKVGCDTKKEFLEAKVVLKKLIIPAPKCLVRNTEKSVKTKPQSLQKTLEKVSKVLQETLVESPKEKRNIVRPLKLEDSVVGPLKRKQGVKRQQTNVSKPLQQNVHKIDKKSKQQRILGRSKQQDLISKSARHKIIKKSLPKIMRKQVVQQNSRLKSVHQKSVSRSVQKINIISKSLQQQKISLKQKQQKIISKQVQKSKVSKPKSLKSMSMPSIALRLSSRKRTVATKIASNRLKKTLSTVQSRKITRSTTTRSTRNSQEVRPFSGTKLSVNSQKMSACVTSIKPARQVSFGNVKRAKNMEKSVVKKQEKKVISSNNKQVDQKNIPKKSTKVPSLITRSLSKDSPKNRSVALKKSVPSVNSVAKKVNKKTQVMLIQPKKILTTDKKAQNMLQPSCEKENNSENAENMAEDEWIVEVLLDENEMDISEGSAHNEIVDINKVSSSDDRPRGSLVSDSERIECDSSTDTNKSKNIAIYSRHAKKIVDDRTSSDKNTEKTVTLSNTKQVSSSVTEGKVPEEHISMSAEKKMAEMRKAIGDLERIADRSMLRLKAEERQVMYLHNKLRQYENDKHYRMLRKIMRDAAPGPKQNNDAVFILDLILSYCPADEDPANS